MAGRSTNPPPVFLSLTPTINAVYNVKHPKTYPLPTQRSGEVLFVALPKYNLPDMNVISLSMIQRAAKYKCNCRYLPKRWCNLIVTSRAWSNTTSGMYENCTGSPIYWRPPMLKKTLACTKTCGREGERRKRNEKGMRVVVVSVKLFRFLFFSFFRVKQVPKVTEWLNDFMSDWMSDCLTWLCTLEPLWLTWSRQPEWH